MTKKILFLTFLFMLILHPLDARVRKARNLTAEKLLKNPSFYNVPVPFPKNRNDIIENLKSQLVKTLERSRESSPGHADTPKEIIYSRILDGELEPSQILKVENQCADVEYEHDFLIQISDASGKVYMNIIMADSGKLRYISKESVSGKLPNVKDSIDIPSALRDRYNLGIQGETAGQPMWISEHALSGVSMGLFTPLRQYTPKDGSIYYVHRNKLYKAIKRYRLDPGITFKDFKYKYPGKILVDHSLSDEVEELELLK